MNRDVCPQRAGASVIAIQRNPKAGWGRLPNVTVRQARRVRIESDAPVAVQVDGDPWGETPVEIEIVPDALEVYAP
jgi:diacylglycerol kinase family enzyme